tara:strand:+ start:119 stop:385 length:267 start_codon:yes stop_codon:yes gene_type:complete
MLKVHYPVGTSGTKFVFKDVNTNRKVLASYSTEMGTPEILLLECDSMGEVTNWRELYGEKGSDLTPSDIFKVVERFNNDPRTTVWGLK